MRKCFTDSDLDTDMKVESFKEEAFIVGFQNKLYISYIFAALKPSK